MRGQGESRVEPGCSRAEHHPIHVRNLEGRSADIMGLRLVAGADSRLRIAVLELRYIMQSKAAL